MGTIWVRELTGGLDTRRMPETTPPGVLIKASNGHITRGGEFEKRAAFVPLYDLPLEETVGVAATLTGLVVFGHDVAPTLPTGIAYQRLQHPDGVTALSRVLSTELNAGKLYVVGEFADGTRHHFYDGVYVPDWFDGRARAAFRVLSGTGTLDTLKVNGVDIIGAPVAWATSNSNTAALIAAAINADISSPEYTATAVGDQVNIIAGTPGADANDRGVAATTTGLTLSSLTGLVLSGGAPSINTFYYATANLKVSGGDATSQLTALTVNGVSIITGTITWATSNAATAAAIANSINNKVSTPEYTATVNGSTITIKASTAGTGPNGFNVVSTVASGLILTPSTGLQMLGGKPTESSYQPGTFVRTLGTKMYSVSGSNLHFSGIKEPTKWKTGTTGAGFVDMSSNAAGADDLQAVAPYQANIAIFAEGVVLIFYIDPDPNLNRLVQVLENTGTSSPRSVTQFGDNDIFYLDESGLRSLRARDSSNAAATTDIGVPVDSLIVAKLQQLDDFERDQVIGLINPTDGRFWLCMQDEIFVFSFYANAKVSAWTTYSPSYMESGNTTPFNIEGAATFQRRVYVRSGDRIFVYGGEGTTPEYDSAKAEAWLPYFDADRPTAKKDWQGIDAAIEGTWEIRAAMEPTNQNATDKIATLEETTYNKHRVSLGHSSTHLSPRFSSKGSGPAKLSAAVLHYAGGDEET